MERFLSFEDHLEVEFRHYSLDCVRNHQFSFISVLHRCFLFCNLLYYLDKKSISVRFLKYYLIISYMC